MIDIETASGAGTWARRTLGSSAARRVAVVSAQAATWLVGLLGFAVAATMHGSPDRELFYEAVSKPLYQDWGATHSGLFFYSPAAAQFFTALRVLPMNEYLVLFGVAGCAAVAWLVAPLGWRWAPQAFLVVLPVTLNGNLEWVFAVVAVLALRYPVVWAIPLLTKVTPGVGAFYYVGRRDWRSFGIAVGFTLAIVIVSGLLAPNSWHDWLLMLGAIIRDSGAAGFGAPLLSVPLIFRGLAALAIVLWGGWTRRPWTIVVAMMLSRPDLGYQELAMLVALPRLFRGSEDDALPLSEGGARASTEATSRGV